MKRRVQIFIENIPNTGNYSKIDLFDDETIKINSSVQNIQDISKVYTDFSQGFTVPSSTNNNKIFQHFYENAINDSEIDGTIYSINTNVRRLAFIEIDNKPFRTGKIELEKSVVENGKVSSYQLTFYGDLVSLKDKFGEDKLSSLDLTSLDFEYNGDNVKSRVSSDATDYDIRFPLISSSRMWTYGDGTSTDISNSSYPLVYSELFPAVRVKKLFDAIATKYNITFNSLFFSDARFKKLFLWCKNALTYNHTTAAEDLTQPLGVLTNNFSTQTNYYNEVIFQHLGKAPTFPALSYGTTTLPQKNELKITIDYLSSTTTKCYIDIYAIDNDTYPPNADATKTPPFIKTIEFIGYPNNTSKSIVIDAFQMGLANTMYSKHIVLKFRSDNAITMKYKLYGLYTYRQYTINVLGKKTSDLIKTETTNIYASSVTTALNSSISSFLPDMKISDFVSGIMKEFNLTCYATASDTFQIEPLYQWYNYGAVIDVTKHIITDEIEYSKYQLYKKIELKYQESESITNQNFVGVNKRQYGDTIENFDNSGTDYTIDVPFENIQPYEIDTNVLVSYSLNKEKESYIPKPVLIYQGDKITKDIKFNNGTTTTTISTYIPFTQDLTYNGQKYSLNFGVEYSYLYDDLIQNTLFATYYYSYLKNIYDNKSRLVNVKAIFPISLLTSLKLNDRLIIRDKRYIINQLGVDLTSGEVDLQLLTDLAPITRKRSNEVETSEEGGTYEVPIYLESDDYSIHIINSADFTKVIYEDGFNVLTEDNSLLLTEDYVPYSNITISPTYFTNNELTDLVVTSSATPTKIVTSEAGIDDIITEDSLYLIDEILQNNVYELTLVHSKYDNSELLTYIELYQ